MGTVDVDAPVAKVQPTHASWSVTLYGVAEDAKEARDIVRDIVESAVGSGLRSGTASAPGLRADLTSAGIIPRPLPVDPTSAEAVNGVDSVKNTPLDAFGLPDPEREVKTYKRASDEPEAAKGGKPGSKS
jgi:hypothetical protein